MSRTAPPAAMPMNRLRRRWAAAASASSGDRRRTGGGVAGPTGATRSVRSAAAVACVSRCSSVGAELIPPPGCTARTAAAEIWNGISGLSDCGSTGRPSGPVSAGRSPLGVPVSGNGQRSTRSAYSAAPIPRTSDSGVAPGSVAGKASATSPSMLTRIRLGWSMDSAPPLRCVSSAAAASDWMARAAPKADGEVPATSRSEPPRIHSETTRPPVAVGVTSRTRARPGRSIRLSARVCWSATATSPAGIRPSGSMNVRPTCRSSAVSSACQNCNPGGPPWNTRSR